MRLLDAFQQTVLTLKNEPYQDKHIMSLIDLTLLDENAEDAAIEALKYKAQLHQVAAICVYHKHLYTVQDIKGVKVATVVNFPEGELSHSDIMREIDHLLYKHHVDEIDFVFPYKAYLSEDKKSALSLCEAACTLTHQGNGIFKVILETGQLPTPEIIYTLSQECIQLGVDFLKTSTGKTAVGATPVAAFSMVKAIQQAGSAHCGIKVSGGVKTIEEASLYMRLAEQALGKETNSSWFRIGASSLLDALINKNQRHAQQSL